MDEREVGGGALGTAKVVLLGCSRCAGAVVRVAVVVAVVVVVVGAIILSL